MFGQNAITKKTTVRTNTIRTNSVFYTIQGEGPHGGRPAVFVRLQGCCLRCAACFVGNTEVALTKGRYKAIKDVRVGEEVLSYNTETGEMEHQKVEALVVREVEEVVKVRYGPGGNANFVATPDHPMWVMQEKRWKNAGDLQPGDSLYALTSGTEAGGEVKEVKVINKETDPRGYKRLAKSEGGRIVVYNMEVSNNHTYFAGEVLAHNCDTEFDSGEEYTVLAARGLVRKALPPPTLVVITGGEPLLQPDLPHFCSWLLWEGYDVQIETSGAVWQKGFGIVKEIYGDRFTVVCSPKTGKVAHGIEKYVTAWKYVVRVGEVDPEDGLPNVSPETGQPLRLARPSTAAGRAAPIYIQPWDDQDEERTKANMALAAELVMAYGYRLSLQTHKIVGVP